MAGSKETPRQRMIGMMYLVLTALLALNVSKEIINAFVKLDKKLLDNQQAILSKSDAVMFMLEQQMVIKQQRKAVEPAYRHAEKIRSEARKMEDYIIACKNQLIQEVEGEDWLVRNKNARKTFKPLMDIETKDDYDAATRLFGGDEGTDGYKKGAELRKKIHAFRNWLCAYVAENEKNGKSYLFDGKKLRDPEFTEENSPAYKAFIKQLDNQLGTVFSEERQRIKEIYMTLTLPEKIKDFEETVEWQLGMFDHAPVVAAAAMFTSLQNDVLGAEAMALDLIGARVKVPPFKFNKIEPMAFAPSAYLNMGDSMTVNIMTAAYDSNEVGQIKWSDVSYDDADGKNVASSKIRVNANKPGEHTMYGKISVKQNGSIVWKPWSFKYEVGQPTGFASPLDMNILYAGINNRIGALASGYPTERISLNAPGCTLQAKGNGEYSVKPSNAQVGQRITLSVIGRDEKGNSHTVGTSQYRVRPLPNPVIFLGSASSAIGKIKLSELLGATKITSAYDASIPIIVGFTVRSVTIRINIDGRSIPRVLPGGIIDQTTKNMFRSLRVGNTITLENMVVVSESDRQMNVGTPGFMIVQ